MSYSEHFRKKILAKLEEGYSILAVAAQSKIDNDTLRADVEKYPDDYQYERAARFGCGASSIGDALKRLGITIKKRR